MIHLVNKGLSDYKIVVGRDAPEPEKHAANELSMFLKEMSGVEMPVLTDEQPMTGHEISIGCNDHQKRLSPQIDRTSLGNEGFRIVTVGESVVIAGGGPRGTMYGAYEFLEKLGCRWFAPGVSRIPRTDTITVPPLDDKQIPVLEYREPYYTEAFDGDWAARNKANGSAQRLDKTRGGKVKYSHFVHTFNSLVPPDEYGETHPEYFSEIDGKRVIERSQLCLTNPDVLKITIQKVRSWIEADPEAMIFSVSQNDWHNFCQCENCARIDAEEGSHSGTMIRFVNEVARAIGKDYPDKAIDTLAYQYTRKPPKLVRPLENVIVRLCSIECCFSHPLSTCPENRSFTDDIKGWSEITDRLYVWDYVTNFAHYLMPFPNLFVLKPNIEFFVDHSVKGIFEEGNYSPGGNGEFAALRSYVMAKLLWNPSLDDRLLINEFLEGYYGKAAGYIRDYIELIHRHIAEKRIHMRIFDPPQKLELSESVLSEALALFDQAEKVAGDDEIGRVQLARLPLDYVRIETAQERSPELIDTIHRFFDVVKSNNVTHPKESRDMNWYRETINTRWGLDL